MPDDKQVIEDLRAQLFEETVWSARQTKTIRQQASDLYALRKADAERTRQLEAWWAQPWWARMIDAWLGVR